MLIYAHRGNSSVYPENTMSAFRSAVDLGVHGIETDVHMTKDGILVITHDEENQPRFRRQRYGQGPYL